jgi:hypothetical protein
VLHPTGQTSGNPFRSFSGMMAEAARQFEK